MTTAFRAIQWAMTVPPIYGTAGRVDDTAHHVLVVLASFADRSGCARPGLPTLAAKAYKTQRAVVSALSRLQDAGLVKEDGVHRGTTVWQLALEVSGDGLRSVTEERAERRRAQTLERVRRLRERRTVTLSDSVTEDTGNVAGQRYVTPPKALHGTDVTQLTALVTPPDSVTVASRALHPQVRPGGTAIELPMNCQEDLSPETAIGTVRSRRSYPPAFEAFWEAYGRKGAKAKASTEWVKAIRKVGPRRILDAVPAYLASRPDPQYRKDAERWLAGECWESIPVAATATRVNGHQPFRNYDQAQIEDTTWGNPT